MKLKIIFTLVIASLIFFSCTSHDPLIDPQSDALAVQSPDSFKVEFKTTKGDFTVEAKRDYSPLAVDRFYYLVENNYYNGNRFFRVLPNFVVQWGMKGIPAVDTTWQKLGVKDEPVKLSNTKGTISFARGGPESRSNQLFINLGDNTRLDLTEFNGVKGFPAFGKVIKGMDVVESINSQYKQEPDQDSITVKGNDYLTRNFPNLDYIISTKIIETK